MLLIGLNLIMKVTISITLGLSLLFTQFCAAEPATSVKPPVVELWPGKVPGDIGIAAEEKYIDIKVNGKSYEVAGKPVKWLTNVTRPSITVCLAPKETNTGTAMIVCPGGGYHNLEWDCEGEEVAAWLNSIGINGIILKYRCPRRAGEIKTEPAVGPIIDAQRAMSLVRARAGEWGIDPTKIGMVGFSAGGHLVGATATQFNHRAYEPIDDIDKTSCRPDFAIMAYSGYFLFKGGLSPTIREEPGAPPMFLVHNFDDTVSAVDNTVIMYQAMKKAGVSVEMHLYGVGGHGFAVRKVGHPCETWTDRCTDWLKGIGVMKPVER